MQNSTITVPAPVEMPVIDSPLDPEVADHLGDDILLSAAAANKTQRITVRGGARGVAMSPRAWTMGGNVD